MIQIKQNFVDRVEQSIVIFKNNFLKLVLPIVLCNLIFLSLLPTIVLVFTPLDTVFNGDITQKLSLYVSLFLGLGSIYLIMYLFILIPIQLGIVKSLRDIIHEKDFNIEENLRYGFQNISLVFRIYWYIFSYVYLLPSVIFILGGLIFISTIFPGSHAFSGIQATAFVLMGLSVLVFLFFAIYRGTKSTFGVISAVDTQEYSRVNFHTSLQLTKGKWWRVFWNLFGISFIIGAVLQLLNFIGSIFLVFNQDWIDLITSTQSENINIEEIISELSRFNLPSFINNIFQVSLASAIGVIVVIFTYLLFKSLQQDVGKPNREEQNSEL